MGDEGDGPHHCRNLLDQRSTYGQRRRTVRWNAANGPFARTRRRGARRVPRNETRPSGLQTGNQTVLVSIFEIQRTIMKARFVVLGGAGAIGRIIVRDLFESGRRNHILIADYDEHTAAGLARTYRSRRVLSARADARNVKDLASRLAGYSVVINCTRHQFNLNVMEAALRAGTHYLDLGGLFVWTRRQLKLNRNFADRGIIAILGMGCAPGLTNVMARDAAEQLDRVDSIRIRVGGIDFNSRNADFAFPYSAQTIVEELTLSPWKWSGGRFVEAAPRSGWESIDFGKPVGRVSLVMTRHSE